MIHHHKPECPVNKMDYCIQGQGQNFNIKHFAIKLGIVIHHHEPECSAKRLVCYFQGRGQIKG